MAAVLLWAAVLALDAVDVRSEEAALALLLAWIVQVGAYAALARVLARGGDATRVWVAGMAARGGALLLAFPATLLGVVTRDAAVTFGLGLTMLIVLEAIWLATAGRTDNGSRAPG